MFLTYPLCLAFEKLKKLAPFAYVFSVAYVILIGFTRMIVGAHYLTDVVGAAIIGYSLFLIVLKIYTSFTKKGIIG
jgi:membrane-associated phospholipid phosphatase